MAGESTLWKKANFHLETGMKSILTITMNPAIDLSASVERVFPNHKLRCSGLRRDPGGGGINVSRALYRLGGRSTALYCAGGIAGRMLEEMIGGFGLPQLVLPIKGETRQNMTIFEELSGNQFRFVVPGPILSVPEWRLVLETVASRSPLEDFVVASGSLPPGVPEDFYSLLAHIVREKGSRLILDTSGPPLSLAVREGVFLIKPSLGELKTLSPGIAAGTDLESVSLGLVMSGQCEAVVVSLGGEGVVLAEAAGSHRILAPKVTVRSRVGAGDSMVAGLTLALAEGRDLLTAARFGVAAGTAAVLNVGTELCHLADVQRLVDQVRVASSVSSLVVAEPLA